MVAIITFVYYSSYCSLTTPLQPHRSWKYWHAGMLNSKKLAIVMAYDIYLECCEGKLDPTWKVNNPVNFHRFRKKLGLQQLLYNPADKKYPGDEKLRAFTMIPKKRRHALLSLPPSTCSPSIQSMVNDEMAKGRLCGDLAQLNRHVGSVWLLGKNKRKCVICSERCHQVCGLCDAALHYHSKEEGVLVPCFFLYHETGFVGLGKRVWASLGSPKTDWKMADDGTISNNRKSIKRALSSSNSASTMTNSSCSNEWNNKCI